VTTLAKEQAEFILERSTLATLFEATKTPVSPCHVLNSLKFCAYKPFLYNSREFIFADESETCFFLRNRKIRIENRENKFPRIMQKWLVCAKFKRI